MAPAEAAAQPLRRAVFLAGRHEALSALGHDVDSYARRGTPLALSQLALTFRAPLRSRDVFRVTVSVARVTAARLVLRQRILRCGTARPGSHAGQLLTRGAAEEVRAAGSLTPAGEGASSDRSGGGCMCAGRLR